MRLQFLDLQQNTTEWLEWRKKGLGASDIPALYGKHPYLTEYQLWLQKTGQSDKVSYYNESMKYGNEQEKIAFDCLKKDHQLHDLESGCIQHPDLPHLRASIDAYCPSGNLMFEIKSPHGEDNQSITIYEHIPEGWIYQMQFQEALAKLQVLKIKNNMFRWIGKDQNNLIFPLRSDPILQADMIARADHWWMHHVVMGNPVEPDSVKFEQKEAFDLLNQYDALSDQEKEIKAKKSALKENLVNMLDGIRNYHTDTHHITLQSRSSYDYNAMKRDGINLAKYKIQKESGSYMIKRKRS